MRFWKNRNLKNRIPNAGAQLFFGCQVPSTKCHVILIPVVIGSHCSHACCPVGPIVLLIVLVFMIIMIIIIEPYRVSIPGSSDGMDHAFPVIPHLQDQGSLCGVYNTIIIVFIVIIDVVITWARVLPPVKILPVISFTGNRALRQLATGKKSSALAACR